MFSRNAALRAAAAGAAVLSMSVALVACSQTQNEPDGPVEITYQSWVPDIDKAVDAFNAAQDDIHVTLETITAGPDGGYAKMLSAVQAGDPADTAQVGYGDLPDFLVAGGLEDISAYVGDAESKFTPWQWQSGVFGDKVYAVPQASGPLVQFYRSDIFEEAGVAYPTTWDEYYEAAKAIRATGPDRYITAFAFNQAPWMIGLAQQAGAQWFQTEGDSWNVKIDDPDTLKMAEYWQRLIDEDLVKVEADFSNEWNADLQSGAIATWISGSWADAILRGTAPDTSGLWSVGPVPQWAAGEDVSATWAGGSANVVLKGSKHPEEATKFLLWLNSEPESVSVLTSIGAGWPAISDVSGVEALQNDPTVFEFYGGQNIWEVAAESDAAVDNGWRWPPLTSTLFASLTDNVKSAIESGSTLSEAFSATQADMVAAMEAKGIAVE